MKKQTSRLMAVLLGTSIIFSSFQCKAQYCSGTTTVTQLSGSVSDGSGSNNYDNNLNCRWLIQPAGADFIELNFTNFDLENNYDFVFVYDGNSETDVLLGSFTGSGLPQQAIVSSGSEVLVVLSTDYSVTAGGFELSYSGKHGNSTTPSYASLPYTMGFESGLDNHWVVASSNNYGKIEVTSDHNPYAGNKHLTLESSTDKNYVTNAAMLHLDLGGNKDVVLDLMWKEFGDEDHSQDGIFISDDGGANFTKVYDLFSTKYSWQIISINISQEAVKHNLNLTNTFVIKLQQHDDYSISTDGFAFDEINVYENQTNTQAYTSLPYQTGFESGLDVYWSEETDNSSNSMIEVTTNNGPYAGNQHVVLGVNNSGAYVTNNINLHLDLSNTTTPVLSFYWKDFGDEYHLEDGIFFSDNGGATFTKVHDLDTKLSSWHIVTLDINQIANANNLTLSNQFVVRFQQRDNYAIPTDGFAFDQVSVSDLGGNNNPQIYAHFPYQTGFESGLDQYWTTTTSNPGDEVLEVSSNYGPYSGSQHLIMSRKQYGQYITNQALLHIDLSNTSEAELSFQWKHFHDTHNPDNGIFISDDGGANFTLIQPIHNNNYNGDMWLKMIFDLDELASQNNLTLSDQFVIKFQQKGYLPVDPNYPSSSGGFAFDDIRVDVPSYTYGSIPYHMDFENGLDNHWQNVSTDGRGFIEVTQDYDPKNGHQHMVMGVVDEGSEWNQRNKAQLFLDLSSANVNNLYLKFDWKHFSNGYSAHNQEDGVYLSDNDGQDFVKVNNFLSSVSTSKQWQEVILNIGDLIQQNNLSLTDEFVIKFQHKLHLPIKLNFVGSDGIALDNIYVGPSFAQLPYSTDFESGLDEYWSTRTSNTNKGRIQVTSDHAPYAGTNHLTMDVSSGGSYVTNEAKLHLNLSQHSQVTLDFYWKEFGDEYHSQDGIHFSDDGGLSFIKVFDLKGNQHNNNKWYLKELNIDQLCSSNGLSLTDEFVIKFVQHDNYPISSDGFAFDDIIVVSNHFAGKPHNVLTQVQGSTELEQFDFDVFPNPTNENVTIKIQAVEPSVGNIDLFNHLGQKVAQVYNGLLEAGTNYIDYSFQEHLPNGNYICILETSSGKQYKSIVYSSNH